MSLRAANLSGADLSGMKSFWSDFRSVDASGASFEGGHLQSTAYNAADFTEAVFTDATIVTGQFKDADLTDAVGFSAGSLVRMCSTTQPDGSTLTGYYYPSGEFKATETACDYDPLEKYLEWLEALEAHFAG